MNSSDKADQPEFIRKQYEFASHIRNPDKHPCPDDVEQRRMNIYSELFYNNVEGFMSNTFPVLRSLYNDKRWHALIRNYFEYHKAHTPLFAEVPREFLKFLEESYQLTDDDFPFLYELAHYEWIELALSVSEQSTNETDYNPDGDLLSERPVLSPLAWPLSYQYPVHQISPEFIPQQASGTPTFIIAYRDNKDEVNFMEVNPVTAQLIHLISCDEQLSGQQMLDLIADQLPQFDRDIVINGGYQALIDLRQKNIILGTN